MKRLRRARRRRNQAPPIPLLPAAPAASPEEPDLEALLEEREQIGYLRGRAEAVEAAWLDPADPSPESLEALAKMGLSLDGSSPFAGRKSVWNSSY